MAENISSIGLPESKEMVDVKASVCQPASVEGGNKQLAQDTEKTLPEYLNGWRLILLTIAFVELALTDRTS
jgi:hypothetical protein